MKRVYRILLRLYPRDYRLMFARAMRHTFEIAAEERRTLGRMAYFRFAAMEIAGLLQGARSEWIAKLTTEPWIRARTLPDVMFMRPAGVSREEFFADRTSNE